MEGGSLQNAGLVWGTLGAYLPHLGTVVPGPLPAPSSPSPRARSKRGPRPAAQELAAQLSLPPPGGPHTHSSHPPTQGWGSLE